MNDGNWSTKNSIKQSLGLSDSFFYDANHSLRPRTNDMSLGRGRDTDIIAIAGFVKNKTSRKDHGERKNKNDGIGTRIRQPGAGKLGLVSGIGGGPGASGSAGATRKAATASGYQQRRGAIFYKEKMTIVRKIVPSSRMCASSVHIMTVPYRGMSVGAARANKVFMAAR